MSLAVQHHDETPREFPDHCSRDGATALRIRIEAQRVAFNNNMRKIAGAGEEFKNSAFPCAEQPPPVAPPQPSEPAAATFEEELPEEWRVPEGAS